MSKKIAPNIFHRGVHFKQPDYLERRRHFSNSFFHEYPCAMMNAAVITHSGGKDFIFL